MHYHIFILLILFAAFPFFASTADVQSEAQRRMDLYRELLRQFAEAQSADAETWANVPELLKQLGRPVIGQDGDDGAEAVARAVEFMAAGKEPNPESVADTFAQLDTILADRKAFKQIKRHLKALHELAHYRARLNAFVNQTKVQMIIGQPWERFKLLNVALEEANKDLNLRLGGARADFLNTGMTMRKATDTHKLVAMVKQELARTSGKKKVDTGAIRTILMEYENLSLYQLLCKNTLDLHRKLMALTRMEKQIPLNREQFLQSGNPLAKHIRSVLLVHCFVHAREMIPPILERLHVYEDRVLKWINGSEQMPDQLWVEGPGGEDPLVVLHRGIQLTVAKVLLAYHKVERFYALEDYLREQKPLVPHSFLHSPARNAVGIPTTLPELIHHLTKF